MEEESLHKESEAPIAEELTRLLGHAPVDWSAEALTHNTHNAVTAGIWRVRAGSASVVLKIVSPGDDAGASEEWSPSEVPSHWKGRIALSGMIPGHRWLTRSFLRDYVLSKRVDRSILYSEEAWRRPLVRDNFPDGLRRGLVRLHEEREWFFSVVERLPRTLCHLDVWPKNLFAAKEGTFYLVDWSFVGEGALGEDFGNLVPDSVFDLCLPAGNLASLDREVFGGYLSGLREAGWEGDERVVRLGMCASAVKYEWLGPLMLQRASNASQPSYGGRETVDAEPSLHRARNRPRFSRILDRRGEGASRRTRIHMLRLFGSNMVGRKSPCGQVSPTAQVSTTTDRFRRRRRGRYLAERSGQRCERPTI